MGRFSNPYGALFLSDTLDVSERTRYARIVVPWQFTARLCSRHSKLQGMYVLREGSIPENHSETPHLAAARTMKRLESRTVVHARVRLSTKQNAERFVMLHCL